MRTAMHYTNAPALVGLSHRGSRVGFHAAAAMRQPYRSTVAGEVCYTYKTAMIAAGGHKFAHDRLTGGAALWFLPLDIRPTGYFYYGTGTGDTLW